MVDAAYPDRSHVFDLLSRIATDCGVVTCVRGFHHPEKDGMKAAYPLMAVIFEDADRPENNASGGRLEVGTVFVHLWLKEGAVSKYTDLNAAWAKVDKLVRAFRQRFDVLLPSQGVTDTALVLQPGPYREFWMRNAMPLGGELQIDYHLHTVPPPEQSPGVIDPLVD